MYVVAGMWHATQSAPVEPSEWRWWDTVSYVDGAWHWTHTALPDARSRWLCGSWQSLRVTPACCIRLCSHEPKMNTASFCCPSGR